jgi:hypothetical protein
MIIFDSRFIQDTYLLTKFFACSKHIQVQDKKISGDLVHSRNTIYAVPNAFEPIPVIDCTPRAGVTKKHVATALL